MILLANIAVERAGFVLLGLALGCAFFWWRDYAAKQHQAIEAESILEKSKREADATIRDARLAANDEAAKIREQTEQSFAARRLERAELERRLAERETLLNAQLDKLMQSEKNLDRQKAEVQEQSEALTAEQKDLAAVT